VTLLEAVGRLSTLGVTAFSTRDAAARLGVPPGHASVSLRRLAAAGQVIRLRRGVWAFPNRVDPLALPELLTNPFPAYVSLQSALYLHGMLSQVPSTTYAVSLARARRYSTPLGVVSIHHVRPGFFFGFEDVGRGGGRLAKPEKALVDLLYLSPARSGLFRALPEIEWPRGFSASAARAIVKRIEPARRRALVARKLEGLLAARRSK
jgi:predicted transcriptional regulator of viral defense system